MVGSPITLKRSPMQSITLKSAHGEYPAILGVPCATQTEVSRDVTKQLLDNGCIAVSEGAKMPTDLDVVALLKESKTLFATDKAANAGCVALSSLERSQSAALITWIETELRGRLRQLMKGIHDRCTKYGVLEGVSSQNTYCNYFKGANIAGFEKVTDAMLAYGVV